MTVKIYYNYPPYVVLRAPDFYRKLRSYLRQKFIFIYEHICFAITAIDFEIQIR